MGHPQVDYDVVIVGAGPAGLSTALHLADAAPSLAERCVVLEARRHPRDKPCAGGVTPGALHYVRRLGIDPDGIARAHVRDVRVRMGTAEVVVRGDPRCFDVIRRRDFDELLANVLAERRGPGLLQDTRARSVRAARGHIEIETDRGTLRCRCVVGADGGSSVVRRSLFPDGPSESVVGLQRLVRPTEVASSEAVFDFSPVRSGLRGYTWDFPTLGAERSVGIFAHGDARSASAYLREHLERLGVADAAEVPLQAARVRVFRPSDALSVPRALLVGDAAGIDPLLGEGIGFALGQGEVATRALLRAFSADDFAFAGYRGEVLRHQVGRCLVKRHRRFRVLATPGSHMFLRPVWRLVVDVGEAATFTPV